MNINPARIVLTKMEDCFEKHNLPFVNESEMNSIDGLPEAISFRSWLKKDEKLTEITSSVYPSRDVVQLTMNNYLNFEEYNESTMHGLFNFLNLINNSNPDFYWVFNPEIVKLEFRAAYCLSGDKFNERQFSSVLERFLKKGPLYLKYFDRLVDNNENADKLLHEMGLAIKTQLVDKSK